MFHQKLLSLQVPERSKGDRLGGENPPPPYRTLSPYLTALESNRLSPKGHCQLCLLVCLRKSYYCFTTAVSLKISKRSPGPVFPLFIPVPCSPESGRQEGILTGDFNARPLWRQEPHSTNQPRWSFLKVMKMKKGRENMTFKEGRREPNRSLCITSFQITV